MKWIVILGLIFSISMANDNRHFEVAKEHVMIGFKVTSPEKLAESVTNGLLMRRPQNQPFKQVYIDFFVKIFSSDEYINQYAKLYMKYYTIEELEYVNKVYSNPKMLNYLRKMPSIMQESLVIGQEMAVKHREELNRALEERAKEIEKIER